MIAKIVIETKNKLQIYSFSDIIDNLNSILCVKTSLQKKKAMLKLPQLKKSTICKNHKNSSFKNF